MFDRFFKKDDLRVLGWAQNVLDKVCSPGLLPVFLNKDTDDFKSFWGAFSHLFALVVIYARQYNEIDINKILFDIFIKERGLITDTITSEEQMKYLFNNYVGEYRKRGRMDIVSKEGMILGELLRLIRYQNLDEFIFALLQPKDSGWTLGHSSPTWNRTDTVLNVVKGYEDSESVLDLNKYPLINPTGVLLQDDISNEGLLIQVMTFVGDTATGISSEEDKSKLLIIDEDLAYQISFKIKTTSVENQNLYFGVQVFDSLQRPLSCIETIGTIESNSFVPDDKKIQLISSDLFYEFRATISKKNRSFVDKVNLNFLNGRGLRLVGGVKYLSLVLIQDRSLPTTANVSVYDIKIKPIYLPFTQGYLGEKNVIASYYRNNSYSSNTTVNEFIDTFLVSYRNIFASEAIVSMKQANILFKVFSERREYVKEATIVVANQTLMTDINGEAEIVLYPGDYSYDVQKENFIPIDGAILSVEEGSENIQVEFVLLKGSLYKRKVTFAVKDDLNRPVVNAIVNFNGETLPTANDGTVVFFAFPELYPYTVKKDRYFPVDKSVLVRDDMVENVVLAFIPIFTVTFIVKNSGNPIQGASVSFNKTKVITDINGQAVFREIPKGNYPYTIEKIDWLPVNNTLAVVDKDEIVNVIFNPVPTYNVIFSTFGQAYNGVKTPLPGVTVTFAGATKISDSLGKVSFIVKQGNYNYSASKAEHKSTSGSLFVNQDTNQDLFLLENVYNAIFVVTGVGKKPLSDVTIRLNDGTSKITGDDGRAIFELPNGSFTYNTTIAEYKPIQGTFAIAGADETIPLTLEQILYKATFNVREENLISVGANVQITGSTAKLTDGVGQVVFDLPKGSYNWICSKSIYVTQNGSIDINSAPASKDINLIRKTSEVTFIVSDDLGSYVEGATITCNNQTKITNSLGIVKYTLAIGNYEWSASRLPDYQSITGTVAVVETDQTVNVLLSNKTYNVTFYVTDEDRSPIQGASIYTSLGSGSTNSNGQYTFSDIKNSTSFDWRATASGYSEETGSGGVNSRDVTINVTLRIMTSQFNINVMKDGSPSNANISWKVYKANGSLYTSGSGGTATGPSNGSISYSASDNECITKSGESSMSSQSATLYLYKALIVTHNSRSTNFTCTSSYLTEWAGNDFKVEGRGPSTLYFSFEGTSSATAIKQWPVSFGLYGSNCFASTSISSVVSGTPQILSGIVGWFKNCSNLRNFPSGVFDDVAGSDATGCFKNSGLSSLNDGTFGSRNLNRFSEVCRGCSGLTSINGSPFADGGGFDSAFRECSSLSSISGAMFNNCTGGYVDDMFYTFAGTAISSFPSGLLSGMRQANMFRGFALDCTNLRSIPANFLVGTVATNLQDMFYGCTQLSSIGTKALGIYPITMVGTFKNCSSLRDITNAVTYGGQVASFSMCFENSGVTTIPAKFFGGQDNCRSWNACFRNCKSLYRMDVASSFPPILKVFEFCDSMQDLSDMFNGCSSFVGGMGSGGLTWEGSWASTGTNFTRMFAGCSSLGDMPFSVGGKPMYSAVSAGVSHSGCFSGCTRVSDYSRIPADWK